MLIEVMNKIINIIQLVSALLLIAAILVQQRGSGLGGVFGGDNNIYRTKRGAEKIIFIVTIILAVLFIGASLTAVFLSQ
jgi:preprotein translocase subunit SecG